MSTISVLFGEAKKQSPTESQAPHVQLKLLVANPVTLKCAIPYVAVVVSVAFECHVTVLLCHKEMLASPTLLVAEHSNFTVEFVIHPSGGFVRLTASVLDAIVRLIVQYVIPSSYISTGVRHAL
jgi:hypothetical protein